jgi:hypothetical protein
MEDIFPDKRSHTFRQWEDIYCNFNCLVAATTFMFIMTGRNNKDMMHVQILNAYLPIILLHHTTSFTNLSLLAERSISTISMDRAYIEPCA